MAAEQYTDHGRHGGHQPAAGHAGHAGHGDHAAQFRDRFWLCLALTVPVVAYSGMVQEWLGFTPLLAVPAAAGALAWAGVTLAPAVGAVLMSLSTIVVALNAQLLRGLDLRPTRA
jgi:hypothetical protein